MAEKNDGLLSALQTLDYSGGKMLSIEGDEEFEPYVGPFIRKIFDFGPWTHFEMTPEGKRYLIENEGQ